MSNKVLLWLKKLCAPTSHFRAPSAKNVITSPKRTDAMIPAGWNCKSTAPAAGSIAYTVKLDNHLV